jgi:hypothetical protein
MKCDICTSEIDIQASGWKEGHNAFPISKGRCCTRCNDTEVIPMRIAIIASGRAMPTRPLKEILKEHRKARALAKVSLKHITKRANEERKNNG